MEAFLDGAGDICHVSRDRNGGYVLRSVATQETAHIAAMVSAQKTKTKSAKSRPRPMRQPVRWQPPHRQQQQQAYRPGFNNRGQYPGAGGGRTGGGPGPIGSSMQYGGRPGVTAGAGRPPQQQQNNRGGRPNPNLRPVQVQSQQRRWNGNAMNGSHTANSTNNNIGGSGATSGRHNPSQKRSPQQQSMSSSSSLSNSAKDVGRWKQELERLCQSRQLPTPEFKTAQMANKKFVSTAIVGGNDVKRFQTFPSDFPTAAMAEDAASKAAVEALSSDASVAAMKSSAAAGGNLSSANNGHRQMPNGAVNGDLATMFDRIVSLVGNRTNGIWATRIEVEFKQKFPSCDLPSDWVARVSEDKRIEVDEPIPGKHILKPSATSPAGAEAVASAPTASASAESLSSPAAPAPSSSTDRSARSPTSQLKPAPSMNGGLNVAPAAAPSEQARPPPITYPQDEFWEVYITSVFSTVHVYLRFLHDEYQTSFDEMVTDMELHYFDADNQPAVSQPQVGRLYAAKVDSEWHRVEVREVHGVFVTCFYIDQGEKVATTIDNLKELHPKFLKLPAQAVPVRLVGLEHLADSNEALKEVQKEIETKALVAQVQSRAPGNIALVLHDTSKEEDVNLNERLLNKLDPASSPPAVESPPMSMSPLPIPPSATLASLAGAMGMDDLLPPDIASLKSLVVADVPHVGEFFDVNVTLAASPSNFTVEFVVDFAHAIVNVQKEYRSFRCNPGVLWRSWRPSSRG